MIGPPRPRFRPRRLAQLAVVLAGLVVLGYGGAATYITLNERNLHLPARGPQRPGA